MRNKELTKFIKNGDSNAFKLLFDKYYSGLVGFIDVHTQNRDLSEDIVQYSFMILWEKRSKLKDEASPKNYLYTIAYNRFVDLYRKKKRSNDLVEELLRENLKERIEEDSEFLEKRVTKLKKLIEHLPPRCKEILYLSKQRGLEHMEIAKKLKISNKTVEEQIRIAYKKIRKGFENEGLFFLFFR